MTERGTDNALQVSFARTGELDARRAVEEIAAQLGRQEASAVTFFVSPKVDFPEFVDRLSREVPGPSIGCTTAGEVCAQDGHCEDGVVATAVRSPRFELSAALVEDAAGFNASQAVQIKHLLEGRTGVPPSFGLLLVDGLSMAEEQVSAVLSHTLGDVPFVGGSAGDDLKFERTWVAANGAAAHNAAAVGVVRTSHPFRLFHSHHFEATSERLVITKAVPSERRVTEVNGEPAAEGYAKAVGLEIDQLSPSIFAEHPVMLSIGGEYYVRSIQKVNPDGSLTFFCAIDEGLVLRVAKGRDLPERLGQQLDALESQLGDIGLVIGFDCILRRLELLNRGQRDEVAATIGRVPFIGFSTYGEQYNGLHVNQTMTGVAIGRAA